MGLRVLLVGLRALLVGLRALRSVWGSLAVQCRGVGVDAGVGVGCFRWSRSQYFRVGVGVAGNLSTPQSWSLVGLRVLGQLLVNLTSKRCALCIVQCMNQCPMNRTGGGQSGRSRPVWHLLSVAPRFVTFRPTRSASVGPQRSLPRRRRRRRPCGAAVSPHRRPPVRFGRRPSPAVRSAGTDPASCPYMGTFRWRPPAG